MAASSNTAVSDDNDANSMAAGLRTGKGAAAPSLPAAHSPTLAVITRPAAGTISSDGNHDLAEMLV